MANEFGGEQVLCRLTPAPGNGAPLRRIEVMSASAWFAAWLSGSGDACKLCTESFHGPGHLARIQKEARQILDTVLKEA